MGAERFQVVLKLANIHDDNRVWFGRWLRRNAVFLRQSECNTRLVSQNSVKQYEISDGLAVEGEGAAITQRSLADASGYSGR